MAIVKSMVPICGEKLYLCDAMSREEQKSIVDRECVDGIIMGIEDSFRFLFDKYYSGLVLFANSYLDNKEASEDVVQSIFVDLWDNRENRPTLKTNKYNNGVQYA